MCTVIYSEIFFFSECGDSIGSLTVMQMMEPGEVEGVLGVLRMLGVMQATGNVNPDTLQTQGLLARRRRRRRGRQVRQVFRQQLQLRHGHGAVGRSRRGRGSAPGVATHPDPDRRGKHAL